jgi:hypothetical protein
MLVAMILLLCAGSICEACGVAFVAIEVSRSRRRSRSFAEKVLNWAPERHRFRESLGGRVVSALTVSTPREIEKELYGRDGDLAAVLREVIGGDLRLRAIGVGLLLLGVGLSLAANLLSAMK